LSLRIIGVNAEKELRSGLSGHKGRLRAQGQAKGSYPRDHRRAQPFQRGCARRSAGAGRVTICDPRRRIDTWAFRIAAEFPDLALFEVDHPASQVLKKRDSCRSTSGDNRFPMFSWRRAWMSRPLHAAAEGYRATAHALWRSALLTMSPRGSPVQPRSDQQRMRRAGGLPSIRPDRIRAAELSEISVLQNSYINLRSVTKNLLPANKRSNKYSNVRAQIFCTLHNRG